MDTYNILVLMDKRFGGCQFFRQFHPHSGFSEHEFNITYTHEPNSLSKQELQSIHLVQMHRGYVNAELIRQFKGLGKIVMVDYDDYWQLPKNHPMLNIMGNKSADEHKTIIKLADYISVSTPRLASELIKIKKDSNSVFVFPNCLSLKAANIDIINLVWDKMQFGYMAGATHLADVSLLNGLNGRLMASNLNYELNLFGYRHGSVYEKYEALLTGKGKHTDNFKRIAPQPTPDYLALYNMLDVSLVPLVDNKFNSMKSELKLIEAGSFSIPVIASPVHPYKDFLKHKKNCLVAGSKSDWSKWMQFFINNPSAVKDYGKQLYCDIQTHFNYDKIRIKREHAYRAIIDPGYSCY